MTLPEHMVEAAARAICRVRCPGAHPCDMEATYCKHDKCSRWHIYVDDARAALTAALAVAEEERVVLVRVPGDAWTTDCKNPYPKGVSTSFDAYDEGWNEYRAATLAGRVRV